ncbi:tripartite tricarboxylate transporter substrate binding protein [Achromobacter sp. MFA1 R4]|uniref:Bug family tripartite tricarboxylate transporter substrate binding protein n=1 Tax=Achromobacter sp. MFA1 R4 TaxID=1881016 RepID=UPI0009538D25|nr:tripartite tricarboxylate transporter substrate binding protein [Achromobacter sp. MFA1 R4]SIT17899.1 Tripartite-type tricarboxylate transporter, receptor component TctC [Achromobacter sp. MFA1 R4]
MNLTRQSKALFSITLSLLLGTGAAAHAQAYPTEPVKIIAPYAAGGAVDIVARTLGDQMSRSLGQPVIVDNRTGAAGNIGVDAVAKSPADGYTLSVALSSNLMINQFLYTKLPYSPGKDLKLVAKVADAPLFLVVDAKLNINNAEDLRKYVSAHKGKLSYGSWGVGTIAHMSASRINDILDGGMVHIAYRGESLMINDLIAGNIQISFATGAQAAQFVADGRLKAIGVSGPGRSRVMPEVPTLSEAGFDDPLLRAVGWVGMAAPAGTPAPIVDKLAGVVDEALKRKDVQERIRGLGWEPSFQGPADVAATYQREAPLWKKVVEQSGAKLD